MRKVYEQSGVNEESFDVCSIQVDEYITEHIKNSLLPIREIALKSIRDLDLEQSKNAIQTMMSIVVIYLKLRNKYTATEDPVLYFLYTEFKMLSATGNNELKLRLHPFIVECFGDLFGIARIGVNPFTNTMQLTLCSKS